MKTRGDSERSMEDVMADSRSNARRQRLRFAPEEVRTRRGAEGRSKRVADKRENISACNDLDPDRCDGDSWMMESKKTMEESDERASVGGK